MRATPWVETLQKESISVTLQPSFLVKDRGPAHRIAFSVRQTLLRATDFQVIECVLATGQVIHLKVRNSAGFWLHTGGSFYLGGEFHCDRWQFSLWALPTRYDDTCTQEKTSQFDMILPMLMLYFASCDDREPFLRSQELIHSVMTFVQMTYFLLQDVKWHDVVAVFELEEMRINKPRREPTTALRGYDVNSKLTFVSSPIDADAGPGFFVPQLIQQALNRIHQVRMYQPDLDMPTGIHVGGRPGWDTVRSVTLRPYASVGDRMTFSRDTEGWMASDEWTFAAGKIRRPSSHYHLMPLCQYDAIHDDFVFDADDPHIANTGISLLPILFGAHWGGIEIDRQHDHLEVAFLMIPPSWRNRIELFLCRMLDIPPHRVNISYGLDLAPPHMCGWTLLKRWIDLTHTSQAFFNTLHEFQSLSDDRKRIIHSVLQHSARAWARTEGSQDLQYVAYVVRMAFLTNIFQFNTSVHHRLDSHAVLAAGQPLQAYEDPASQQGQPSTVAEDTTPDARPEETVAVAEQGTQTDSDAQLSLVVHQVHSQVRTVHSRLAAFSELPGHAASDELDHIITLYRQLITNRHIMSCCKWDLESGIVRLIGREEIPVWLMVDTRGLMLAFDHWFAYRIHGNMQSVIIHIYGFPSIEPAQCNAFIHAFTAFLHIDPTLVRTVFHTYHSPEGMCGFLMLRDMLSSCGVQWIPPCHEEVHFLQMHPEQEILAHIGQQAVAAWQSASHDQNLIHFAFTVRAIFLSQLLTSQVTLPFETGGTLRSTSSSTGHSSYASRAELPLLSERTRQVLIHHIRAHIPVQGICSCHSKGFTAQAILTQYVHDWGDQAVVACKIIQPTTALGDLVGNLECGWPKCSHEQVKFAHVLLPKEMWQALGPDQMVFIVEAKLLWNEGTPVVDLRAPQSGLTPVDLKRKPDDNQIRVGEFFAGGFSGWSFAMKCLQRAHLPVHHAFSVENDIIMARNHALNHTSHPVVTSPQQAQSIGITGRIPQEPFTIVANIEHAWWHFLTRPIDVLLASPPCQPWSRAGSEAGLESPEGRLLIFTLIQCAFLRPAVLCLEEVASVLSHRHFTWFREFLKWSGYSLVWCEPVNLGEILPHARNRMLMVAVREGDPRIETLEAKKWCKPTEMPTLSSVLLPASHHCHGLAPSISKEAFDMYFKHTYLPRRTGSTPHEIRRCRVRTAQDQHPCVMANYAFAHELPEHVLREGGLLGSFVLSEGQLRWLAHPELVMLFGCTDACHVPNEPKIACHMLGNAIAVPHALLCLLNGIAQLECIRWTDIPLWILEEAVADRITKECVAIEQCFDTHTIRVVRNEVSPTQSWEEQASPMHCLRVVHEDEVISFHISPQVSVFEFLRMVFHLPTNAAAVWKPRGDSAVRLPLFAMDTVPTSGMFVEGLFLGPMTLEEKHFMDHKTELIVALTPLGIFAMHRTRAETVEDVIQNVSPFFQMEIRAENHLGRVLEPVATSSNMMIITATKEDLPTSVDALAESNWSATPDCLLCITTMFQALSILKTYSSLGLNDVIRSVGWKNVLDASRDDTTIRGTSVQLTFQRCAHMASIPLQDLQNLLSTRLFIAFLNDKLGNLTSGIAVSVKLWDSHVWQGFVTPTTPTGIFADAWDFASRHVGKQGHLRTLLKGARTNHEWSFQHYVTEHNPDKGPLKIHMIMEAHGGGSKAESALRTKQEFSSRVLQVGFDPIDSKQFVNQLYQEAGAARLRSLLNVTDEEAFIQQCGLIAKQTRITLPQLHDLDEARHKRVRATLQNTSDANARVVASSLRVQPGTFCLHDGTEVPMCSPPDHPGEGVMFVEPEDIVELSRTQAKKAATFMAIVPGIRCPLQNELCQRFHIPVVMQDETKAVITACCHSLGKSSVTVKLSQGDAATVTDTTKAMFVTWRAECPTHTWETLLEAPIHTVFKCLEIVPAQSISGPPQGRSWRALRQQSTPEDADTFCFYARIVGPALNDILKRSGTSGIYITPKSEHSNLADSQFSVVWTQFDSPAQAMEKADTIPYSLGIVRNTKDKPAFGIRTLAKDFDTLWQQLRPTDPKPSQVPGDALYKITPIPEGATHEDVTKWIQLEKLNLRPLRALSSTSCLLIGEAGISKSNLTWQQNAVLIQPIDSKYSKSKSAFLTGKRPAETTRRVWKQDTSQSLGIDPLMLHDPWAHATTHVRPSDWTSNASTLESASSSSSRAAASTCHSDTQRHQQKEIDQMKSKLDTLETAINTQRKDANNLRREVKTEFQQVRKEVADRVTEVQNAFQTTLTEALTQTQTALRDSFRDDFNQLKQLLGANPRKRVEAQDENMEED